MTPPDITHRWTWTGQRDLPDWLTDRHHWHHDRPVIHTTDGPRTLYTGWLVALWTDGVITVGSVTVAERVYGDHGIAGRLAAAETALARQAQETATWRATANTLDAGGPGTPRHRAEQAEQRLARVQRLLDSGPIGTCCDRLVQAALNNPPAATQATEAGTQTKEP